MAARVRRGCGMIQAALCGAAILWAATIAIVGAQDMAGTMSAQGQASPASELAGSVHRTLSCGSCHGERMMEMGSRPDPIATCIRCHTPQAQALSTDGHVAALRAGNTGAPSCVTCHGSHGVLSRRDSASPTYPTNVPAQCGACHAPALRTYRDGVHSSELEAANNLQAATCASCHTAHGVARGSLPWSTVAPARVASTCAACHLEAGVQYAPSVHAIAARRGAPHPGTCVDCHSSHAIPRAREPSSPTSALQVSGATCAKCHEPVALTELHGLEPSVVSDFRGSFHGMAGALGDRRVANCASCHGYHEVRPSWDPQSRISGVNLATTCGQCHTGAAPGFARGGVHHLPRTVGHRLVDLARVMYKMMIVGIIGLMLLHNGVDFFRRWHDGRAARSHASVATPPAESHTYLRFTLNERFQHWTLAASFITLAVTGFALTEGWNVPWVSGQTGATMRAAIHRAAAAVFMALALYHFGYLVFTARGRQMIRAIVPRLRPANVACCAASCLRLGPPSTSDWRNLIQTVKYNLGLTSDRPRHGRFTYAEKMEYFALAWGAVVMIATGLALWFEVPFLNRFPFWSFQLATVVHLYEALLASLAIVVWHFYFTMFNPDVFPISKAMITGELTHEEMAHEHPEELCEIECADDQPFVRPADAQRRDDDA